MNQGKRKKEKGKSMNFKINKIYQFNFSSRFDSPSKRFSTFYLLPFTFLLFIFVLPTFAQDKADDIPADLVPPPLNIISEDEKEKLEKENKIKDRVNLAFQMMEARVLKSEELVKAEDYTESLNQLGYFQGLVINTMKFLKKNENDKAVLKHYKKLEMNLREYSPRLELIRREMPYKYGYHIKQMLNFIVETRSKALNPLFGDTVLDDENL